MKTQIIRRLSLAVIAVFISFSNQGSTVQSTHTFAQINTPVNSTYKFLFQKKEPKSPYICCDISASRSDSDELPGHGEAHEFHSFHFEYDEKRYTLWKRIGDKLIDALSFAVLIVSYYTLKIFYR